MTLTKHGTTHNIKGDWEIKPWSVFLCVCMCVCVRFVFAVFQKCFSGSYVFFAICSKNFRRFLLIYPCLFYIYVEHLHTCIRPHIYIHTIDIILQIEILNLSYFNCISNVHWTLPASTIINFWDLDLLFHLSLLPFLLTHCPPPGVCIYILPLLSDSIWFS